MYFIPLGMLLAPEDASLGWGGLFSNLLPVTLGNLVGGAGLVGLVYYVIYVRKPGTNAGKEQA
jgi:formate/nitrite transporter FocA (FNT family)